MEISRLMLWGRPRHQTTVQNYNETYVDADDVVCNCDCDDDGYAVDETDSYSNVYEDVCNIIGDALKYIEQRR